MRFESNELNDLLERLKFIRKLRKSFIIIVSLNKLAITVSSNEFGWSLLSGTEGSYFSIVFTEKPEK